MPSRNATQQAASPPGTVLRPAAARRSGGTPHATPVQQQGRASDGGTAAHLKLDVVPIPSTTARYAQHRDYTARRAAAVAPAASTVARKGQYYGDSASTDATLDRPTPLAEVPLFDASPAAAVAHVTGDHTVTARGRRARSDEASPAARLASPAMKTTRRSAGQWAADPKQTPGDAAELWEALVPDDDPMTATQEALPPADGFVPPSPPPLFSLRSTSRDRSSGQREEGSSDQGNAIQPMSATQKEKCTADLWASSARAYFERIDKLPLRTAKSENAPPTAKVPLPSSRRLQLDIGL